VNALDAALEIHQHFFTRGPRSHSGYGRDGKWHEAGEVIAHSHPGGSEPHTHPECGPSFYGYGKQKMSAKPRGEQLALVPLPEDASSFTLVITDSAKFGGKKPIGETPLAQICMPAADRMVKRSRLRCIIRGERGGQ